VGWVVLWTSVIALDASRWLLGGTRLTNESFAIAVFDRHGAFEIVWRSALEDHFTAQRIERAREDGETCGFDLASVADLIPLERSDEIVVALGGDGECLDACYSACTVGTLSLSSGRLVTQLIDDESGCSGMVQASDRAIVIDCGGMLKRLSRIPSAA
jgi:hypothetical protein